MSTVRAATRRLVVGVCSVVLVGCLLVIQRAETSTQGPVEPVEKAVEFEPLLLQYLWPALAHSNMAGRIYYAGVCPEREVIDGPPFSYSRVEVRSPAKGQFGLRAVREIFAGDRDVSVQADSDIVRITIGTVREDVLHVRIASLVLTPAQQYNYLLAVEAIEYSPEVRSAMQKLRLCTPPGTVSVAIAGSTVGLPHLPAQIRNVTVDQALDLVAQKFDVTVIYGFCASHNEYDIRIAR